MKARWYLAVPPEAYCCASIEALKYWYWPGERMLSGAV